MRITTKQLRRLIEVTWRAAAPGRLGLPDMTVDAESSREAGENAAKEYGKMGHRGIDPFSISVEPMKEPVVTSGKPIGGSATSNWEELLYGIAEALNVHSGITEYDSPLTSGDIESPHVFEVDCDDGSEIQITVRERRPPRVV